MDAQRIKEAANRPEARPLSAREMLAKGGRPYRSKYFAGTLPWHHSLGDVNLANGNLFKSFTDIQVAPAKGAGLAMQRTYNSQSDRIGPFGQGCTFATSEPKRRTPIPARPTTLSTSSTARTSSQPGIGIKGNRANV